jgi:RNA polymerase sigma-70 factor, ECF subfamily
MKKEAQDDAQLMADLQAGDDGALSELITRWQAPLTAFVYRYLQNHADTRETVQEVFVRVYQSRSRYRPTARFSTWLFTIAANLCRNRARWRRRHPSVPIEVEDRESDGGWVESNLPDENAVRPQQPIERHERAMAVRAAVEGLPHDLKTALLLFQFEHLSHQEIADVVGCSPKAVETRIYRARQALKKELAWLLRDEEGSPALLRK